MLANSELSQHSTPLVLGDLARPHSEVRKLARRARWPSRRGRAGRRWYRSGTVIRRPTSCQLARSGVFAAPTTGVAEQDVDGNKLDDDVCVCTACGGSSDLVRRGGCDKSYCVACGYMSGPVATALPGAAFYCDRSAVMGIDCPAAPRPLGCRLRRARSTVAACACARPRV